MSKEQILKYCGQWDVNSLQHMEQAMENKRLIERGLYDLLNGCPSGFGLDDHIGLCETDPLPKDAKYSEQCSQCETCWKLALEVEEAN